MTLKPITLLFAICLISIQSYAQLKVTIDQQSLQVCYNEAANVSSTVVTGTPTSYTWSSSVGTFNTAKNSSTTAKFVNSGFIYLNTFDGSNTYQDSVWVKVNALPTVKMPAPLSVCCDAEKLDLRLYEDFNSKGGIWSCWSRPYLVTKGYEFQTGMACGAATQKFNVRYGYTDSTTGCVKNDSFVITVNPLPSVELRDGYFCQDKQLINLK